jgi:hypothetical protein
MEDEAAHGGQREPTEGNVTRPPIEGKEDEI